MLPNKYENLYFSPQVSVSSEKINTGATASESIKKQDGSFFETNFFYTLNYDLRDRTYKTTDGSRSILTQKIPLASDDYAITNGFEFTKWHQFENKMISDLGFYLRAINSLTDEDVKVSKRLNLPKRRMRGFETGKVGPMDGLDYIGGNYATAINISTTLPQILPSFQNTNFSIFYDAANVWSVDYDSTISQGSKIRSSVGLAVDFFTAVGPLNFSLSEVITKGKNDVAESFRFNLGTTF